MYLKNKVNNIIELLGFNLQFPRKKSSLVLNKTFGKSQVC